MLYAAEFRASRVADEKRSTWDDFITLIADADVRIIKK